MDKYKGKQSSGQDDEPQKKPRNLIEQIAELTAETEKELNGATTEQRVNDVVQAFERKLNAILDFAEHLKPVIEQNLRDIEKYKHLENQKTDYVSLIKQIPDIIRKLHDIQNTISSIKIPSTNNIVNQLKQELAKQEKRINELEQMARTQTYAIYTLIGLVVLLMFLVLFHGGKP